MVKVVGVIIFVIIFLEVKVERFKVLGVVVVVNYKEDIRWGKVINKLFGGGVDYVLDVGGGFMMK